MKDTAISFLKEIVTLDRFLVEHNYYEINVVIITFFYTIFYSDFSQRYDNGDDPHSIYQDYPPYPDPFVSTFRSFSNGFDISKVTIKTFL